MIEQAMRAERENGKQAVILVGHGSRAAGVQSIILLIGGTSETAPLASGLAEAGYEVLVSTATAAPLAIGDHPRIARCAGRLDEEEMVALGKEKGIRTIVDAAHLQPHLRPPGSSHLHPAGSRSARGPSVVMFYPNNRSSRNGWIQNSSFPQRRRLLKKSFPVFISRIFACFHKISLTSKDAFLMLASNKNKFLSDFFVVSHKL